MKRKIMLLISIIFLFSLITLIYAQEIIYCEDNPYSSNCICRSGEKTVKPCEPSGEGGCPAIVMYECVSEFNISECVSEWESKNLTPDNYDLKGGELSYVSGKVLVGYDWRDETSKDKAVELLESYGLTFEDLGGIGFTVTVPVGSEFEWLCKLQQREEFKYAELETIFTGTIVEPEPCDAYWEGYVYDSTIKECKLKGASGCNNPFEYQTKEECERMNLPEGDKELVKDNKESNSVYWIAGTITVVILAVLFLVLRKRK